MKTLRILFTTSFILGSIFLSVSPISAAPTLSVGSGSSSFNFRMIEQPQPSACDDAEFECAQNAPFDNGSCFAVAALCS